MKNRLLMTSALVTVGMLASDTAFAASMPKLAVGGSIEFTLGIHHQDEDVIGDRVAVDVQHDRQSEIHFNGSYTTDNGIRFRTRVELEDQSGPSADLIDEAYMTINGKWGEIRVGSKDNAAKLMTTPFMGSWATNVGPILGFDVADWVERPMGHGAGQANRLDLGDRDSEKISYFTPRIGGFQVGVTYMPSFVEGGNSTPELTSAAPHEGYAIAANVKKKLGGVGIGFAAGYAQIHEPAGVDQSPIKGFAVGSRIKFRGITLSAGTSKEINKLAETDSGTGDIISHDFGAKYDFGKNHVSLGYQFSESGSARLRPAKDQSHSVLASYRRDLGPSVQYRLNLMYAKYVGEVPGPSDDNEGVAVTTSVFMAF